MDLYAPPQLRLLLALAALLLLGLGVREWRAGFPAAAERLERFDRAEAPGSPPALPVARGRASPRGSALAPSEGPPADPRDARPVDINRASADELTRLPGVGPALARRIVEERDRRGPFGSAEGLRSVLGLGPKKLAALRDRVTVGASREERKDADGD